MHGAAEVYREAGNAYWLPVAEERIIDVETELAAMKQVSTQ